MIKPQRLTLRAFPPALCWLIAAALLFSLGGCAAKRKPAPTLAPESANKAWVAFKAQYCNPPENPAIAAGGVLYVTRNLNGRKRTNRLTWRLWGNLNETMRMDVLAGIGSPVAHIRENAEGLTVYYPQQNSAYFHHKPVLGVIRLGMPIPFSLRDLASLLAGDWSVLVPRPEFVSASNGNSEYVFSLDDNGSTVNLLAGGRPMAYSHPTPKGAWMLLAQKYPEKNNKTVAQPAKFTFTMPDGERGVLRLRTRELKLDRWSDKALKMEVPAKVVKVDLGKLDSTPPNGGKK